MTLNEAIIILSEAFGDDMKRLWLKSNPELSHPLIDDYIKRYNIIRNSRPKAASDDIKLVKIQGKDRFDISKFKDWMEFEAFVDYVSGQIDLEKSKLVTKLEIDDKPLVDKNGMEIYYADSPQKCIKYKGNVNYSWCVSRSDSGNAYFSYRYSGREPAFYFVKNKERTKKEFDHWSTNKFEGQFLDKYHFFVIQALPNAKLGDKNIKSYVVTSAQNGDDKEMSWSEILKIEPKLNGMQEYFKPVPLTDEEKYYYNKFKNGVSDEEFQKLSYNEKSKYLDISPFRNGVISDIKFLSLPDDLKNKYIGIGLGLRNKQYEYVKTKKDLYKRYVEIVLRKYEEYIKGNMSFDFNESENDVILNNIPDDKISDKLINHILYISKDKLKIIDYILNRNIKLTNRNVATILIHVPDKEKTIDLLLNKGLTLTSDDLGIILRNSNDIEKTIDYLVSKGFNFNEILTNDNVEMILRGFSDTHELINKLLNKGLTIDKILTNDNVRYLLRYSDEKEKEIEYLLSINIPLTDYNIRNLMYFSPDKEKTIDLLLNKGLTISKILSDEILENIIDNSNNPQETINYLLSKGALIDQILKDDIVKYLLYHSYNVETMIDYLLSKNVPLTDKNVSNLLRYTTNKQKLIDYLLNKNVPLPLTDENVSNLLINSSDIQKTIDTLLSNDVPLTDKNVYNLLTYSLNYPSDKEKIIDTLLNKNIPLTDRNVYNLLSYSFDYVSDKEKIIDYLLNRNMPLTKSNIDNLLRYSSNKSDTQAKIDALRAKQQGLTERHLNYKSFFRYL